MELLEVIKEAVNTVGFPIFCVVVMFNQMKAERASHEKEAATWANAFNHNTEVLHQNTLVLEKISDMFRQYAGK